MNRLKPSEKKLFIGIWVAILAAFVLWKFRPRFIPLPDAPPTLSMHRNLTSVFESAWLMDGGQSAFVVGLKLQDDYRARLGGSKKEMRLHYRLAKESAVLFSDSTMIHISPEDSHITATLPNPARIWPKSIALSLSP